MAGESGDVAARRCEVRGELQKLIDMWRERAEHAARMARLRHHEDDAEALRTERDVFKTCIRELEMAISKVPS